MRAVGLYDPAYEHDACGVAFVARLDGTPSHETLQRALEGARQPRASRGRGRGREHRRRRRHPRPVAGCVLPRGASGGAAAAGALRRRRLLPAARPGAPGRARATARGDRRGGGTERGRLARRSRRRPPCRRNRGRDRAADPAALRRRRARAGRRRVRAEALRDPPPRRACRRTRARRAELLRAQGRLQGNADRASASRLLPRSARRALRQRSRARAFALLDEHLPELGARAPVPADRAQRRDQHGSGQRQLDARARVSARVRALRRRPPQGAAGGSSGRIGHGELRQRARVAAARGPLAPARGDDDDPGGVREPRRPAARADGLLRVPPVPAGGLGRTGRRRLHRRTRDRRDARPQRSAPGPLVRDERRLGRHGLRDRRARRAAGEDRPEGEASAGQAVPRRPRPREDRRGRGGQARGLPPAAVRPLVRRTGGSARRPAGAGAAARAARDAAQPPARVRLRAGGHERDPRAARAERRGARRVDGERHVARRALRPQAAPLLVLQAALRAGDEPADRLDPRGGRDERAGERRVGAQPARRDARARAPARDRQPDPARLRARAAAPGALRDLQGPHARHHVAGRRGSRRDGARAPARLRRGGRGAGCRREHPHPLRSRRRARSRAHPVAARRLRGAPPPRSRGHAPAGGSRPRVGRGAQRAQRRHARRLRRGGGQPVPDARDAGRARRPRAPARGDDEGRGAAPRGQGDRQGPAQDDVEDGHLDDAVLLRRADLRGGRARAGAGRAPLHRHGVAHRRDRDRDARRADAGAPRARLSRRGRRAVAGRRSLCLAPRRRAPPVEPGHDRPPPARSPPRRLGHLRGVLAHGECRERAPPDDPRPPGVQVPRGRRHPARRGRAGRRRSSSASRPARCRSARSRARRTRRSPSR